MDICSQLVWSHRHPIAIFVSVWFGLPIGNCLRWRNNELRRDIFLHDGLAILVPVYNKTQAMMDATKTIPRFLPLRLTRLYILFLATIRPFLQFLQQLESSVQTDLGHSLAGFFFFSLLVLVHLLLRLKFRNAWDASRCIFFWPEA